MRGLREGGRNKNTPLFFNDQFRLHFLAKGFIKGLLQVLKIFPILQPEATGPERTQVLNHLNVLLNIYRFFKNDQRMPSCSEPMFLSYR